MKSIEDMTLDEKVGEILKFQRRFYHMAVARSVSSILIFLIFVILPIIATYFLFDYISQSFGPKLTEASETLEKTKGITDIDLSGLDELKSLLQ